MRSTIDSRAILPAPPEAPVRTARTLPPGTAGRPGRLLATLSGLLALAALLGAPASAQAAPAAPSGAARLAEAARAVLAADVTGTAWAADPATGTLRVVADETVSAAELAAIRREAGPLATALTVERVPGELAPMLEGGDRVYSNPAGACTIAVNARAGSVAYALTAGHCTVAGATWYTDVSMAVPVGPSGPASFPGDDFGTVVYTNPLVPVERTQVCGVTITGVGSAVVGQSVRREGSTTGCRSGTVTGLNYTVNYGGGVIVSGLIRTNVCAEPGDSGGPLAAGSLLIGILSGGSGNCSSGGVTYYQPVNEVLAALGATIV
jgi:streptogrisin B